MRKVIELRLGTLGKIMTNKRNTAEAIAAMQKNVILQPMCKPMIRPSGRPTIMAIDVPVTIIPRAMERCPSGAIRTARGEAIDQKTA